VNNELKVNLEKIISGKLEAGESTWFNSFSGYYLDLINFLRTKNVYIFGAGRYGQGGLWHINHAGIKPVAFIDSNVTANEDLIVRGLPVIPLAAVTDSVIKDMAVIIMIGDATEAENVKGVLQNKGIEHIYVRSTDNDLVEQLFFWEIAQNIVNHSSWDNFVSGCNDRSVFKAFDLLEDDISKKAYYTFLDVMCNGEYQPEKYDDDYMPKDVPLVKGYGRFIDAGAYRGENGLAINNKFGPLDAVAFIEPDAANMEELKIRVENSELNDRSIFFQCALWDKEKTLRFNNVGSVGSHLSEQGGVTVQCLAIDEILRDFNPTMIKMDIEKAEYNALIGARKVIQANKPDLLISVYHSVDDIWRIIILIDSWNLNYKFYLRHHNPWGVDTVLYAVCAE